MTQLFKYTPPPLFLLLAFFAVGVLSPVSSEAQDRGALKGSIAVTKEANLKSLAKISEEQAEAAALTRFPGAKVSEVDLENEGGFLVYDVELKLDGKEIDVLVDAGTGSVLRIVNEDEEQAVEKDEDGEKHENDDDDEENEEDDDGESAFSSSVELPSAVQMAFKKAWPNARITGSDVEETDGTTYYEVESIDGSKHRDLLYFTDGRLYETEESMEASELPDGVRSAALKHGKVVKAEKITRGPTTEFEVLVQVGEQEHELVLDPSGKLLKSKVADKED